MVLRWYVLKEHLVPFLFSFAVIMFLLVIDLVLQMIDLILGKGIAIEVVLELFFLNTAWMVALAVPMAVLVGTLMAFGRLSGDNEITAMRALGVGPQQVAWPVFLVGALIGGLLVVFNDRVLPEFNYRARILMSDIQRKRPAVSLEAGIIIQDFENYNLLVGTIDERTSALEDVIIYKYEPGGYPVTFVAERGEVIFSEADDEALLTLYRGETHRVDETDPEIYVRTIFEKTTLRLGEAGRRLSRTVSHYRTDREMSVGMMLERVSEYEEEARSLQAESGGRIADFLCRYLFEDPPGTAHTVDLEFQGILAQVQADASLVSHKWRAADRYRVEVHKKFSIPAACLTFILVGAPLGVRVRGSSPAVGAGISIGFFLIYWLCLIGGEKLADRGFVSPWFAMWSPNIIIGLAGAWMLARLVFERRFRWRRRCAS